MNAQEYIESGLLEAYIAGALTDSERTEVEAAISQYPEVAAEVTAIEETMWRLAERGAVPPPPALQEDVWNAIKGEPAKKTTHRTMAFEGAPVRRPRQSSFAMAATLALLIGSLALNFYLWSQSGKGNDQTVALQHRVDSLQRQQQTLAANLSRYQHEADMMADPSMKPVLMQTAQPGHPMAATVYWSKDRGEGYVSVQKLPPPPAGMQYQLWALADGKPVDLGVLPNDMVGTSGMQKITKSIPNGQAFAISLEKEGGSPTPTMDKIFVMGKVSS